MQFKIIQSLLLGYVNVVIEGYNIERLLNILVSKKIVLWNNKRIKSTVLNASISIKDFKLLCKIAKETKCKIKIKKKKGIVFIFNKYKKRKIFFICLALIVFSIIYLSLFVWNIDVIGMDEIEKNEIIEQLKEEGLEIGTLKNSINTKEIINQLRLNRNDLAWVGIEIKGTNVIVKVVKASEKPSTINEDDYCNIVATKDGIITKINAVNGTPLVKEGDVIKKGTVAIGGYLEGKYTGTRYVHANGEVYAKVWYLEKQKIEENIVKIVKTGNEENHYSVKFNNFQINFYKTLSKFKKYDTIVSENKLKLFSDFYLPIVIIKSTNYEQKQEEISYSKEEAKNIAITKAKDILNEQIKGNENNIINTYIDYDEGKNEVTVIYEMLEEIGTKEKIVF